MAISTGGGADTPMSDINTTPLVDVMLVLLIIFLIAIPVAIQTIEDLEIPVMNSRDTKAKVENVLLTVSSTDANGVSAGEPGYTGVPSPQGQCRVYFNNITPVSSDELYERVAARLEVLIERAGGPDAMMENPDLIPEVHIRGDKRVPWRCVAGAIYTVQIAGYPIVGFISDRDNSARIAAASGN